MPMGEKAVPEGKLVCMPEKDPTTIKNSAAATLCEPNHQNSQTVWKLPHCLTPKTSPQEINFVDSGPELT